MESSRTQQWKLKPYPAPGHFLMLGTLMPSATREEAALCTALHTVHIHSSHFGILKPDSHYTDSDITVRSQ
jgi:hypothetical protein